MACYGPKEVRKAFEMGAIDTMMISDVLFRNSSLQLRRDYVELVTQVKDSGSTCHVFSSGHVTGQKLKDLADIAAILRFQVEYDEEEAETQAAAAPTASAGSQDAAEPAAKPKLERALSTASTVSSAPQQKPGVAELMMAL